MITNDSDIDRDSDSCPVLFDTFVDYRLKASYEGSKELHVRNVYFTRNHFPINLLTLYGIWTHFLKIQLQSLADLR